MRQPIPFPERIACTVEDAVEATSLSRSRLYELIAAGTIRTVNVGRRRLVLVRSLMKFVDPEDRADRVAA